MIELNKLIFAAHCLLDHPSRESGMLLPHQICCSFNVLITRFCSHKSHHFTCFADYHFYSNVKTATLPCFFRIHFLHWLLRLIRNRLLFSLVQCTCMLLLFYVANRFKVNRGEIHWWKCHRINLLSAPVSVHLEVQLVMRIKHDFFTHRIF